MEQIEVGGRVYYLEEYQPETVRDAPVYWRARNELYHMVLFDEEGPLRHRCLFDTRDELVARLERDERILANKEARHAILYGRGPASRQSGSSANKRAGWGY